MLLGINQLFCPFSGQKVEYNINSSGYFHYLVSVNDRRISFLINHNFDIDNSEYYTNNQHIFRGLFLNQKWPTSPEIFIVSDEDLRKIISQNDPPITPKEKLEFLFLLIYNKQKYEGQTFSSYQIFENKPPEQFYLRAGSEEDFYIDVLADQGFIEKIDSSQAGYNLKITFKGVDYAIDLLENGKHSNNCFIAMSFSPEMKIFRESIKVVCRNNGFNPILVDEQKIDSDQTINDAIIANLKKSSICIADFTEQKDGVYFESGYALGRGQKVLYLCREDWFQKSHFDTNHFPHIIYSDTQDLEKKLDDKIKAWIL